MSASTDVRDLASWNDTATRQAILDFVDSVTTEGSPSFVAVDERVAVFDNDGALWCEKPMPNELGFILHQLAAMAERDEQLRGRQPWKAAYEKDVAWLGGAMTKHYQGDDSDMKVLQGGVIQAFAGWTVDSYCEDATAFLHQGQHPTLGRRYVEVGYRPMVELLGFLSTNGFACYIASGGDRDFMRPVTHEMYGIPPEHVIGSSNALRYQETDEGATVVYLAEPDVFDDGEAKPVRIWSRIGRRPILAVGNSNGDIPMLNFAGGPSLPSLRLLVLHDDDDREFAYTAGAETALEHAGRKGWTVVSMKEDWATVFDDPPG
jgi:phosphoserine phosphatase